jgi:hypothetical protein
MCFHIVLVCVVRVHSWAPHLRLTCNAFGFLRTGSVDPQPELQTPNIKKYHPPFVTWRRGLLLAILFVGYGRERLRIDTANRREAPTTSPPPPSPNTHYCIYYFGILFGIL